MKRVLSLVLALVMVLGMIPTFAAEMTGGEHLLKHGFITGKPGDDVATKLDAGAALTRQELAALIAELMGKKDEASVFPQPADYADAAKIGAWAVPYVAYAQVNGWMSGKPGNLFDPTGPVPGQQLAAVLMNALGYSVDTQAKFATVIADAAAKGIVVPSTNLTRGQAFEAMWTAVSEVKVAGEDLTLGQKLNKLPLDVVSTSVKVLNTTTIELTLGQAADTAAAANFTIAGITVQSASLSADGKVVTLAVSPLKPAQAYTLKVSGLKSNAVTLDAAEYNFTVPAVTDLYKPILTVQQGKEVIKADGASQAVITFELRDAQGNVMTNAQNVEVQFSTTFGSFAQNRVALQQGKASLLLTSEFLVANRTSDLRAVVIESQDANLIGLFAEAKIIMSPNPEETAVESLGASMMSAESNQADRVTVYFNKPVDRTKYINATGGIDAAKAVIVVREQAVSSTTGNVVAVKGLMAVPGNANALTILLDVDSVVVAGVTDVAATNVKRDNALTDNAPVFVSFTDKTGSVEVARTTTFNLTDARKPAMLRVENETLRRLIVTFSEAVDTQSAMDRGNWSIDGKLLSNINDWGTVDIKVGQFNAVTGVDARNVVTITLGTGKYLPAGNHSIQASNISDWAFSDVNNKMVTQTLDFNIAADTAKPVATVEVMSPEQWLITFNRDFDELSLPGLVLQVMDTNGTWITDTMNGHLVQRKIDDNKILVETTIDWTQRHNTSSTNKNHFNYSYRLSIPANQVMNVANGLRNDATQLTLGGAMTYPDVTSPIITDVTKNATGLGYSVVMSEPVKLPGLNETRSQSQTLLGIPAPTADFIKADFSKTVPATVSGAFADSYDKVLTVTPDGTLDAGEWIIVVRSISDDIGNTAASITKNFTVTGPAAVVTDFRILWAEANHLNVVSVLGVPTDINDQIYVKFSKAVATFGNTANALATTNYTLNGLPLPQGTQIVANIAGYDNYDNVIDSITIILPNGTLASNNGPHVLNVTATLTSSTGEALANPGEKLITAVNGFNKNSATVDGIAYVNGVAQAYSNVVATAQLKAALADASVYNVNINGGITLTLTEPLTIPRNVNLNLGVGSSIVATTPNTLTLAHNLTGRTVITGGTISALTVNTPFAELEIAAGTTITTLNVTGLYTSTLFNAGTIGTLNIKYSTSLVNRSTGTVTTLNIDATRTLKLTNLNVAPGSIGTINNAGTITNPTATGVAGTFAVTTPGSDATLGTAQVETATVVVPVAVELGDTVSATVIVNGGAPVTVTTAAAAGGETAIALATELVGLLNASADAGVALYTYANGGTAVITATKDAPAANDATFNIALANVVGDAITAAPTSTNTTVGVAPTGPVAEVATFTVTSVPTANGTIYVTVNGVATPVAVTVAMTTADVATAIAAVLTVPGWNVAAVGATVTLTDATPGVQVDLTGSIQ